MIYVKNIDHVITFSSKTTVNVEYILVISITKLWNYLTVCENVRIKAPKIIDIWESWYWFHFHKILFILLNNYKTKELKMLFTFLLTFDKHNVNSKIYVQSVKILLNLILRQRLQACMRHETLQRFLPKIFFHLELKYFSDIPPFVFVI